MKILVLGRDGQVGQSLMELSHQTSFPIGWTLVGWDRSEGDFSDAKALVSKIATFKPDAIINAAAYTQVDRAETERDLCEQINALAPAALAMYCKKSNIPLVHFSSDYVYAGTGAAEHEETEVYSPQNFYGATKAGGDTFIADSQADYLIFRTSWVYSYTGKNFVKTMKNLGEMKSELSVVDDQFGAPTYAPDLSEIALNCLMLAMEEKTMTGKFPSGVYHLANSGVTTWADFARAIIPQTKIIGIPTAAYPTPAKRPLNSRLSLRKLNATFKIEPKTWQDALARCLKKMEQFHA